MTDWRALCAELLRGLDENRHPEVRYPGHLRIVMADARAALAEPQGEGPTRDEAVAIYSEVMAAHGCQTLGDMAEHFARAVLARWGRPAPPPADDGPAVPEGREPASVAQQATALQPVPVNELAAIISEIDPSRDVLCSPLLSSEDFACELAQHTDILIIRRNSACASVAQQATAGEVASALGQIAASASDDDFHVLRRAVDLLTRPAPPPAAAGEVGELVEWLRKTGDMIQPGHLAEHQRYKRAADLLTRLALQPVPVAERLPGAGDCIPNPRNGEGEWCWGWRQDSSRSPFSGRWRMVPREFVVEEATHWLPAHALPLPV